MAAVAGYTNKTEAIRALAAQGLTPFMIAEQIGSTPGSVSERIRQLKRIDAGDVKPKAAKPKASKVKPVKEATRDTRGIWTPEKLAKARRLFGKIMIYVAEALEVPADELLEYGLKGVVPPMGEKQRVAQLQEPQPPFRPEYPDGPQGMAQAPAAANQLLQLAPPAQDQAAIDADQEEQEPIELDRAADEAELAAIELEEPYDDDGSGHGVETGIAAPAAQAAGEPAGKGSDPVTPPAPVAEAPRRYRLKHWTGQFVENFNKSGLTLTRNRALAWVGTAPDMEEAFKVLPELKDLDPEKVLP